MSSVAFTPDVRKSLLCKTSIDVLQEIMKLTALTAEVRISSDVRAYLHNIVVFMRLHRAVRGGISAMATRHFDALSQ